MPSLTITTTVDNAQRLAAAVGYWLNLGRSATEAEVKQAMINEMKRLTRKYETLQAVEAIVVTDITPT